MKVNRAIVAALVLIGLATVGGLYWLDTRDKPPTAVTNAMPKSPSLLGGYSSVPESNPTITQSVKAAPQIVTRPGMYPQEDEFRQLMGSSNPRDNARGYSMAWLCANEADNLRMNERVPGAAPVAPKCGLAPGSWQDAELRKKGVIAAAKLGLPNGWANLYLEEGPGGRLAAFSEAEREEWKRLVAETYPIAIKAVDSAALGHEAVVQEAAGNYARAVELYVASMAALARRTNQPYISPDATLEPLKAKMNAADFNQAVAEGHRMAKAAKPGELL